MSFYLVNGRFKLKAIFRLNTETKSESRFQFEFELGRSQFKK